MRTTSPDRTGSPAAGAWAVTRPFGVLDERVCTSPTSPFRNSTTCATTCGMPTTAGISGCRCGGGSGAGLGCGNGASAVAAPGAAAATDGGDRIAASASAIRMRCKRPRAAPDALTIATPVRTRTV